MSGLDFAGRFRHGCNSCIKHFGDDPISTCTSGHHICNICRRNVFTCPVCESDFTGRRNTKLEKSSRKNLGLDNAKEKGLECLPKNLKHNLFSGPPRDKGNFRCRVQNCNANLPICRILNHCRSLHRSCFVELSNSMYNCHSFTVPMADFTKIYQSSQYGLLYICCKVTKCESSYIIRAWVQIATSEKAAKEVRYNLVLHISNISFSFCDIPHSLRLNEETILKSGHYLLASVENANEMNVSFKVRKNQGAKTHKNTVTNIKIGKQLCWVPN